MFNRKNKRGISPLIATVLIIGFTIVLAALVITWGTKLFQDTVSQTQTTSRFSLACTAGLRLDVVNKVKDTATNPTHVNLTLRNNNQEAIIEGFRVVVNMGAVSKEGNITNTTAGGINLVFPVPKAYRVVNSDGTSIAGITSIDLYPIFTIEGQTRTCEQSVTTTF